MALPTVTVGGQLTLPNSDPIANARVKFTLSVASSDLTSNAVVLGKPFEAVTDANGNISLDLWANERGFENSHYNAVAYIAESGVEVAYKLGSFQVTAAGSHDLATLLTEAVVRDADVDAQTLEAALRAETAAQEAEADRLLVNPANIEASILAQVPAVVDDRIGFQAIIDSELGGVSADGVFFETIDEAMDAAPYGCHLTLRLMRDQTHVVNQVNFLRGRSVRFLPTGGGANPIVAPTAVSNGTHNLVNGFSADVHGGGILSNGVDWAMPAKADAGLPWDALNDTMCRYSCDMTVQMRWGTVTFADTTGIMSAFEANAHLQLGNMTCDGPGFGVKRLANGTASIARVSVTAQNGFQYHEGGTLGQNVLMN
ncbi:MAG: hypothetical protein AAF092_05080 [Pseudomonadota bacterium]